MISKSASVESHPRASWKRKENNFFFKTVDNNDNILLKERDSEIKLRNVRIKVYIILLAIIPTNITIMIYSSTS